MMPLLSDEIAALAQRTGTNTADLSSQRARRAFTSNVRADLANVIYQINTVYKPLIDALSSTVSLNALDYGLAGNIIFTDVNATSGSGDAYYDSVNARSKTVKESFDTLLTEISVLENAVENLSSAVAYDDTAVRALISTNNNDIDQLKLDAFGPTYTLDGDGVANNTYPITQVLDAIGASFTGYASIGAGGYTSSYPALSLSVLLSAITLDTTLAQSVITDLPAHLTAIRSFTGMSSATDSSPTYSAYGAVNLLTDGRSLERSLFDIDNALAGHGARHIRGGADEIDGDKLDIDYSPVTYTPDTTPAQVTHIQELTSHLAGIDNALTAHSGIHSMQGMYDNVVGSTAGDIELDSTKGPIEISDDPSTPINQYLALKDSTGSAKYTFSNTTFTQADATAHAIGVSVSDPSTPSTGIKTYSKLDGSGSGKDELYAINDSGEVAQITRDGLVREALVASLNLDAHHWLDMQLSGAAGASSISPTRGYRYIGSGTTSWMPWTTYEFSNTTIQYLYAQIRVPMDEDGNFPTRFQVRCSFLLDPVGGSTAGGSSFVMALNTYKSGGVADVVQDNESLARTWDIISQHTYSTHVNPTRYAIIDFDETTLLASDGVLHLRLLRNATSGSDNYADGICFTGCNVNFYR